MYSESILKIRIYMEVIDLYNNDNNIILIYLYETKTYIRQLYIFTSFSKRYRIRGMKRISFLKENGTNWGRVSS